MRSVLLAFFVLSIGGLLPAQEQAPAAAYEAPKVPKHRTQPWPEDALQALATLPVQESGRIKPLETYARFLIFVIRGSRGPIEVEYRKEDGGGVEKLDHVAWLLDCWFYPEQARHYRAFRVDDIEALRALGLEVKTPKRADKLSFAEIEPVIQKLGEEGERIRKIESDNRTPMQRQILDIANRFPKLGWQIQALDFARDSFKAESSELRGAMGGEGPFSFLDILARREALAKLDGKGLAPMEQYLARLNTRAQSDNALYVFAFAPSVKENEDEWGRIGDLIAMDFHQMPVEPQMREQLNLLWQAARGSQSPEAIAGKLMEIKAISAKSIDANPRYQGEDIMGRVEREHRFYMADYFYKALVALWVAFFICLPMVWVFARRGGLGKRQLPLVPRLIVWLPSLIGFGLLVMGIYARCMVRGRPPVTTPYEGWLFIGGVVMLACIIVELVKRSGGAALLAGNLLAVNILHIARWQEIEEGGDTIVPLLAVLDTNYWLSIHVTTITAGYGAALLAALLGIVYQFFYFTGGQKRWPDQVRFLNSFIYGVVCFGAVFATVGTILGGVWANDSWGRFWGWDPKENGALMLCLGLIVMLHARMGGYIRQFGMATCSIGLGVITMWAFWGVNLLGVGLHSYGFDESKATVMNWVYTVGWSIVGLAVTGWGIQQLLQKRSTSGPKGEVGEGAPELREGAGVS